MSQAPNSPLLRYVDNGANLPEVVGTGQHPYADGPQVINSGPHHAPEPYYPHQNYDTSPEAVYTANDYKGGVAAASYGAGPHQASAGHHGSGADGAQKPVSFWRNKRTILLAAVVALLVIIGAVVGGVVGSQRGKSSTAAADSSTPTTPTQAASPPPNIPAAVARRPGTAASTSRGTDVFTQGIQIFWQDKGSSDITYSVYNNGLDYGPLRKLDLSRPPSGATPLAATSWFVDNNRTNDAMVQLYYLLETTTNAGRVDIAMADLICSRNQTCIETGITIITANVTAQVASNSDITAVWRRDQKNFRYNNRVYYQAKDTGSLIELSGDKATTTGWAEIDLKTQALNGSSLASVFAEGHSMELYYLDVNGAITELVNTDKWAPPTQIKVDSHVGAQGTGVLEALWEPSTNIFRIYRVTDKGSIIEYNRSQTGSLWSAGMSPNGRVADSTMTLSAWDADVRLFFLERGVMKRASRGDLSWKIDDVKDI